MANANGYFAAREADDAVGAIENKIELWSNTLESTGYLNKLRDMYAAYHGAYFNSVGEAHQISFGGDDEELVELAVNHLRNLGEHMLTMMTSSRPSMECRAINTDYQSLIQTQLGNGLLDYYMREKKLEQKFKDACELAIVLGSGWIKLSWNSTLGEVINQKEMDEIQQINNQIVAEQGEEVETHEIPAKEYEGDVEIDVLSPLDIILDLSKENQNHDWIICRSFKNRYDLIAKYPDLEDSIMGIDTKESMNRITMGPTLDDETDDIPVYEFYHKKTAAVPDGRYIFFASKDAVFYDGDLPYKKIPVYPVYPGKILGTPLGYTNLFDILPIQDAMNSLYSTIMSNNSAFGVQNILNPSGSNIDVTQLGGALNIIDYNPQAGEPKALQLTKTAPETYQFVNQLNALAETISGINSVVRGNPEANLRSGSAIAMIQSNAIQFMSGLQASYTYLIENVGLGLLEILQEFAHSPRIANIVGESGKSYVKEFKGDNLNSINRVTVDSANPLTKCLEKGTKVLMFDGTLKNIEDIKIGEKIMGPDSEVRTVSNIGSGFETMYKIRSKDKKRGVEYGTNESHILTLRYCSDDKSHNFLKGQIVDITVKDFLELPKYHQNVLQGFKTGVEFEEKNLPIPPYILGLWLGDGHSRTPSITTMDQEILTEWTNYAKSLGLSVRQDENTNTGNAKTYHITSNKNGGISKNHNQFKRELRELELIQNKHIPQMYLNSSREQRLDLLAGLLDTDGTLTSETFIIGQKNKILADNIVFLAESLGFRVTIKKEKVITNYTRNDKEYFSNRVSIGGNTNEIPTKLERKQAIKKDKSRNWLNYGIEIECVGEGEYFGIVLKEEPHFVLGDFTVTHNTISGRTQMADNLLQYQLLNDPQQYINIINTGNLDVATEDTMKKFNLIRGENEQLMAGLPQRVLISDHHQKHIQNHLALLDDPVFRQPGSEKLIKLVLDHVMEHKQLWLQADPVLLAATGQQPAPVPPPPMPPAPPQGGAEAMPPEGLETPANLPPVDQAVEAQGAVPNNVRLPEGFEDIPLSPEQNMQKIRG